MKKQIKEIRIANKQEKKQARAEYKSAVRLSKVKKEESIKELYETGQLPRPKDPPKRAVLEEIGNAVTHGVGAMFGIAALIIMLVLSENALERAGAIVYGVGLSVMFSMSCLYHSFRHGLAVKRLFRRFDYSSIYLLIGATFAPVLLGFFSNTFGFVFFGVQWAIIATGITFVGVFGPTRLRWLHIPLYVLLGWSAIMLLPGMISGGALKMALFILGGGITYSVGIIPFILKKRCSHFIWHFFVLAGAVVQWVGIFTHIYLG